MYIQVTYTAYIILSLTITIWVGMTLFRNGRVFLLEAFLGNKAPADAVNHLLLMAFYLINIGFIALFLRYGSKPSNWIEAIETVSTKVGIVLVVSGGIHLLNMWLLAKIRKKAGPRVHIQSRPIREPKREPKPI